MLRFLLLTALMLSGCTYSTNPIFTKEDNVFDEAFLGAWEAEKDAMFDIRKFEVTRWGPEEKSYRVVLRNEADAKQGTFQLFLSQIDRTKKPVPTRSHSPTSRLVDQAGSGKRRRRPRLVVLFGCYHTVLVHSWRQLTADIYSLVS